MTMRHTLFSLLGCALMILFGQSANAQTWDFSVLSDTDIANLNADTDNWTYDSSNNRWKNTKELKAAPLMANGVELAFSKGLLLTASTADRVRVDNKKHSLTLNGAGTVLTIKDLKAGTTVTIACQSSSSSAARGLTPTNLTVTAGFEKSTSKTTNSGTVTEDGDVTFTADGGLYLFSVIAGNGGGNGGNGGNESGGEEGGGEVPAVDHATKMNTRVNQAVLTTQGNVVKYYNTTDLQTIAIDRAQGTVTVNGSANAWQDVFTHSVSNISFAKAAIQGGSGEIDNKGVEIMEASGWLESAYVKWAPLSGATYYRVYVRGGQYAD